jgi:hypothetical protein
MREAYRGQAAPPSSQWLHSDGQDEHSVRLSQTAYEMLQFELHHLRSMVTAMLIRAQLAGRHQWPANGLAAEYQEMQKRYRQAMYRALRDPDCRRYLHTPEHEC